MNLYNLVKYFLSFYEFMNDNSKTTEIQLLIMEKLLYVLLNSK